MYGKLVTQFPLVVNVEMVFLYSIKARDNGGFERHSYLKKELIVLNPKLTQSSLAILEGRGKRGFRLLNFITLK